MKPHPPYPKLRKTIKWGGAAVTVLLVVVWIGSGWRSPQWKLTSGYGGSVNRGLLGIAKGEPIAAAWFRLYPIGVSRHRFHWWFDYVSANEKPGSAGSIVYVPLWLLVAPAGAITVVAWRVDSQKGRSMARGQSETAFDVREKPGVNVILVVAIVGAVLLVEWILQR